MRSLLLAALAALGSSSAPAAQDPAPDDVLVFRSRGTVELLPDARDASLRRLVELLPRALDAHTSEPGPAGLAQALLSALHLPLELRVGFDAAAEMPVSFALTVEPESAAAADALAVRLAREIESAFGEGEPRSATLRTLETPQGALHYGTIGGSERWLVALAFGREPLAPEPFAAADSALGAGVRAVAHIEVDLEPIGALIAASDEDLGGMLELFGLGGERPLSVEATLGYDAQGLRAMLRMRNQGARMAGQGATRITLDPATLAVVPSDATYARVWSSDPQVILDMFSLAAQMEQAAEDPLEQIEAMLGVDLERDVFAHLGTTGGYYASTTTGGGGLGSLVAFHAVKDGASLRASAETIAAHVSELVGEELPFAFRAARTAGPEPVEYAILAVPGLPIPLEPCLALQGGWLVAAVSPAALEAALAQMAGAYAGDLRDNPRLSGAVSAAELEGLVQLEFLDAPRLLERGYTWTTLGASMMANLVRSNEPGAPDPGRLLPTFRELAQGARPWISLSRLEGDDLVTQVRADRSWWANGTAMLGSPNGAAGLVFGVGMAASFALPMLLFSRSPAQDWDEESWELAPEELVEFELAEVKWALDEFAIANGGSYPDSLDVLTMPDENGYAYLGSPFDPWGYEWGYAPPTEDQPNARLWSYGADGVEGGEGADADVHWSE